MEFEYEKQLKELKKKQIEKNKKEYIEKFFKNLNKGGNKKRKRRN